MRDEHYFYIPQVEPENDKVNNNGDDGLNLPYLVGASGDLQREQVRAYLSENSVIKNLP
jgi:hypothetical protein